MRYKWLLSVLLLFQVTAAMAAEIKIDWEYKGIPPGMKIYDLKSPVKLWTTESVKDESKLPFAKEIPDSTFKLEPGKVKRFALGYKNTTDKTLYFFAAPHSVEPPENSLGFKFKCLCVNHAYQVAPGETWYRIVEYKLSRVYGQNKMTVKHNLIGIDSKQATSINSAPPVDAEGHQM
jgi:hypothetical protein